MITHTVGSVDFKLTKAELLYLGAAAEAKVLFGIPGSIPMSEDEMRVQWDEVRRNLIAKSFADEKDEMLEVRRELSELIRVLAYPKLFMVCTSRIGGRDLARNYYCNDGKVVRLTLAEGSVEEYYLTEFTTPERLSFELQTFLAPPHEDYLPDSRQARLTAEQFQSLVDAIALNDDAVLRELVSNDFPEAVMLDLKGALTKRDNLSTVVTVLIDKDGENRVGDFLLVTAAEYLWQIEVHAEKARIRSVAHEDFLRKTEVLSEICFYY